MTDPTQPRSRGRHSQADADGNVGLPASELLAAWASEGSTTLQLAGEGANAAIPPRRRARHAPDTDATGVRVLPPRSSVDVADVEITGLDAAGIADLGLAAAGLDLSAFGIDRPEAARHTPTALKPWSWGAGAIAEPAPRTAEMIAVPPAVPDLDEGDHAGRGSALDRRTPPAPRPAAEPTLADRVVADRYADADTNPGWVSANRRPVPGAIAPPVPPAPSPADEPQAAAMGSLAALFTGSPATGRDGLRPVDEAATEVHAALLVGEDGRDEDPEAWRSLSARHRSGRPDDGEDAGPLYPEDLPFGHDDHPHDLAGPTSGADHTGGLEVVVPDDHDDLLGGGGGGGGRGRRGGGGREGGRTRTRKRRRPIIIVLSLLLLAALVGGILVGGKTLWDTINPVAEDYSGTGTGSVDIRVNQGDSLRTIAGTLVQSDVIASTGPFEDAAEANPAATGIQPGVYTLRLQMSGKAALDLLLDPASRQVSKVTLPEGLTVTQVLNRLAEQTGIPLEQFQAAAADPAALGLPAYANGLLEGFLFPATYDIEPGDTPVAILSEMVSGAVRVLDGLQIPEDQRLGVVTEASIVQAEAGSVEDMGKVARVLENRLADGMPLQLDTTVNYANGKSGITTTAQDRANPSPYNTYAHPGLPPGAISNPGEEALRAVLNPTPGEWLFFVVVDPDTGDTRFAVTGAEHNQNVLLFQEWLREHPGN